MLAVFALLTLVLAACGDDDTGAVTSIPSGDRRTAATDTTLPDSPEEQAVAVYQEGQTYLSDLLGHRPPDPQDAGLEQYFSGDALSGSRDVVAGLLSGNEYADSTVTTNPRVVDASDDSVVLDDCLQEQVTRFDISSGAQKASGSNSYNLHVTVLAADGAWKVDTIEIREDPCTP